eukprot:TRINITY_DN23927_c0_g1_i2.p1 TRINITY_DN23927_c0_g1~~TRINITY_DN23927_c0_g1_i2.p1  ORF type:complete len:296 (+),score=108.38 TRINITY_DN23927_c0_g1_i2:156-1043(+)
MLEALHREQMTHRGMTDEAVDSLINDATKASEERHRKIEKEREDFLKNDPFEHRSMKDFDVNNPYGKADDYDMGSYTDRLQKLQPGKKARFGEYDDVMEYEVGRPTGAKMYGRCYSTRSDAGDIKIMVDVEGMANKKAFFIDALTKYSGFRKAVERKVGKIYALCYEEQGLREMVEVDDDETFTLFLERGGKLLLTALKKEPFCDATLPNWSVHSCHAQYAGSARPLPPVDTRPAPHTTRAPPLVAFPNSDTHSHVSGAYCNQCGAETSRSNYNFGSIGNAFGSMLSIMTPKIKV